MPLDARLQPRIATVTDAPEMVRLAGIMFESMGHEVTAAWTEAATDHFSAMAGEHCRGYVIEHPDQPGRLIASGVGLIHQRLTAPPNPAGTVGYIQWVCTDAAFRRRGLSTLVMTALLDWYGEAGVRAVELHATADGEPVYRRLGFSDAGPVALRRRDPH